LRAISRTDGRRLADTGRRNCLDRRDAGQGEDGGAGDAGDGAEFAL
jgi:hypothetical protein